MLVIKCIAFALIFSALFWSMSELFSFNGLLYMGEQWSWLAAFFLAILASVIMAWMLAWLVGRMMVILKLNKLRPRHRCFD